MHFLRIDVYYKIASWEACSYETAAGMLARACGFRDLIDLIKSSEDDLPVNSILLNLNGPHGYTYWRVLKVKNESRE